MVLCEDLEPVEWFVERQEEPWPTLAADLDDAPSLIAVISVSIGGRLAAG